MANEAGDTLALALALTLALTKLIDTFVPSA